MGTTPKRTKFEREVSRHLFYANAADKITELNQARRTMRSSGSKYLTYGIKRKRGLWRVVEL